MFALINGTELILGPIEFNYRLINSALEEDLEVDYRVSPSDYSNVPIIFDENIKILKAEKDIPYIDQKYEEIFLSDYQIFEDKVCFSYLKKQKDLELIKKNYKSIISAERWKRENFGTVSMTINDISIEVSTSRESRISLITKLSSGDGPYNFKFGETWIEITSENIKNIISKIDEKIQLDFDWEYSKIKEIDLCSSFDEIELIDFFNIQNSINKLIPFIT